LSHSLVNFHNIDLFGNFNLSIPNRYFLIQIPNYIETFAITEGLEISIWGLSRHGVLCRSSSYANKFLHSDLSMSNCDATTLNITALSKTIVGIVDLIVTLSISIE